MTFLIEQLAESFIKTTRHLLVIIRGNLGPSLHLSWSLMCPSTSDNCMRDWGAPGREGVLGQRRPEGARVDPGGQSCSLEAIHPKYALVKHVFDSYLSFIKSIRTIRKNGKDNFVGVLWEQSADSRALGPRYWNVTRRGDEQRAFFLIPQNSGCRVPRDGHQKQAPELLGFAETWRSLALGTLGYSVIKKSYSGSEAWDAQFPLPGT